MIALPGDNADDYDDDEGGIYPTEACYIPILLFKYT